MKNTTQTKGVVKSFRDKYLALTIISLFSFTALHAQKYDETLARAFGVAVQRLDPGKVILLPTGCSGPTSSTLSGTDSAKKKAALYFDSCYGRIFIYNPHGTRWDTLTTGAGGSGAADSAIFVTVTRLFDSNTVLRALIDTRAKYTDTAAMLLPYLLKSVGVTGLSRRADSVFITVNGVQRFAYKDSVGTGGGGATDTSHLSDRINLKLNIADTAGMLTNYKHWLAGYLKAADIAGKLNISDTANIRVRLHPGTNVTITGTYPDQTISASGGGTDNSNTGSYYRLVVPSTQAIKTLANKFGLSIDSVTFAPALAIGVDSATIFNYVRGFIHDTINANSLELASNFGSGHDSLFIWKSGVGVFKDVYYGFGLQKDVAHSNDSTMAFLYDTTKIATVDYALYLYNLLNGAKKDKDQQYGTFFTTTNPSTFPADLYAPSAFYSMYSNAINFSGGAGYWNNYIRTDSLSAATKYKITAEFTLTTKPNSSSEGICIGRWSANSTNRADIILRAKYVDATHWTIGLYYVYTFTTITELASVPYTATIPMNAGDKYRIEMSVNGPYVSGSLSRIDSTKAQYKDILETINLFYKYSTILNGTNMANTGGYGFGALGTTNTYRLTKFDVQLNSRKNPDVVVAGNSLTGGYNATNIDNSYVSKLFANTGLTYEVFAGQGDKTEDWLLRINEIILTNPRFALLEFGWNDYTSSVTNATFETNFKAGIQRLQAAGIPCIIVKFPNNVSYDTSFYNIAKATGAHLIDLGYQLYGFLDAYNIHMNDYGHELAANYIRTQAPEIFGYTAPSSYQMPNQYLSKDISANTNWDNVTALWNLDATAGQVNVLFASTDASMIGRKVEIVKTDASSNPVGASFYGGATVNGASSFTVNGKNMRITLTCTSATTWVATVSSSRNAVFKTENATNSNLTIYPGVLYNLNDGTISTNRTIDVSNLTSEDDISQLVNNENGYGWTFTGATVYLSDKITTVTTVPAGITTLKFIDGKIIKVDDISQQRSLGLQSLRIF